MKRSNCFFFALSLWLRWRKQGAYFAVRNTRHLVGWHWVVQHPKYKRWIGYEPYVYHGTWWREAVAKFWYRGKIVRDDKLRNTNMKNPVLTLSMHVSTDKEKDAFNDVKTYKGMDAVQIAQFQAELAQAFADVLSKYAQYLSSK